MKTHLKADKERLTLFVCEADRVIFTISCINQIHFYTCAIMLNKFITGEIKEMDNSILNPKE